jgi:TonB-linked SusC/RagA family outer membrane protein
MNWTAIFILGLVLQVSAHTSAQTVTYSGKQVPVSKVLAAIKSQTGYGFFYNSEDLRNTKPVTVTFKNTPLQTAMEEILKDQSLEFDIQGNTVFISKRTTPAPTKGFADITSTAPTGDVHGTVTDEKMNPIPNITVFARSNRTVTVTGPKGEFHFQNISDGDTLQFSSVSYESRMVAAVTSVPMVIVMKPKIVKLDEVIVYNTGFQTLSNERATGSFSKPDMEVYAKRTGTMDIIARLEGQIPGMLISSGPNSSIVNRNGSGVGTRKSLIRGIGSVLLETEPLYVLNGVTVNDFSAINPDDIEDITILKDAAASAIWGARSANGVVVITTKSGNSNKGSRMSVSYSGFINYSGLPDFGAVKMLSSQQYIQTAKEIFDPVAFPMGAQYFIAPHDQVLYDQYNGVITANVANRKLDSLAAINNMGQIKDIWYRPAITTNHTVSASGGNNVYSFYAALGYTGTQSNTPGERNNAFRLNLSQNINAGSRVRITLNTSLVNTVVSRKNPISIDNNFIPYQLFRDENGNPITMNYMSGLPEYQRLDYQARSRINLDYNPMDERDRATSSNNNLAMNVTANVNVKIWKGLSFAGTYGYQKNPGTVTSYADHTAYGIRQQIVSLTIAPTVNDVPQYLYPITGGNYTTGNNDQRNWTVRNQLVYDASPRKGRDHLTVQVGQESQETASLKSSTTLVGYDDALGSYAILDYAALRNGVPGTVTGYGSLYFNPYEIMKSKSRFISWFGLASYTINGKYSIDASYRQDNSNLFGTDISSQNKPVESIGGRWQISKEAFMKPVKWVNYLGLRATYGITGNSPYVGAASRYDILRSVTASNTFQYSVLAGDAFTISNVANKTLSWERTANVNLGIDYSVLRSRISGSINFYKRVTTDMLGTTMLNPLTGYASTSGNLGKMTNSGVEVSINTTNIKTNNFYWSTGFNIAYNKNKLVSYSAPNAFVATSASYRLGGTAVVGYPMSSMWAYRFAGLDNMGDPQIYLDNKTVSKQYNIAQVADLKYMGTKQPPVYGGITNMFGYKGFNLSLNMVYHMGALMRRPVNDMYTGRLADRPTFSGGNTRTFFLDRWKKPGDEAFTNVPSYVAGWDSYTRRNIDYYTMGDINVVSASYIKLRDVTFSYELQNKVLQFLRIQRLSIFTQATNFLVWAANKDGFDPEYAGSIPPYKHSYSLGVNLSF